jgi:hypothetical protein
MNIFERAARNAYRFKSVRGSLTTEQLFELPLLNKDGFCLNSVAVEISNDLENFTSKSFVVIQAPETTHIKAKLDIVKHIIATKQAAQVVSENRLLKAEKRRKLVSALVEAENREMDSKSREELLSELAVLDEEPV